MPQPRAGRVRRSFALPRKLVEEATQAASPELRGNLNRLVVVSLEEFVARRKAMAFEEAMARMAGDAAIREQSTQISAEFEPAALDGLGDD